MKRKNAKASDKITVTKIVFQISEHKSIRFPKPAQRIGKILANFTVFICINFLSQCYYHCYKWLCHGSIQGMNQNQKQKPQTQRKVKCSYDTLKVLNKCLSKKFINESVSSANITCLLKND